MDITTLALAKKFAKEYTDTHASKLTEEDALVALSECGIVTPAYQDETFYTDADGVIYTL